MLTWELPIHIETGHPPVSMKGAGLKCKPSGNISKKMQGQDYDLNDDRLSIL